MVVVLACFIYEVQKFENFRSRSVPSFSDKGTEKIAKVHTTAKLES